MIYKIGRSLHSVDIVCLDKQQYDVWTVGIQVTALLIFIFFINSILPVYSCMISHMAQVYFFELLKTNIVKYFSNYRL